MTEINRLIAEVAELKQQQAELIAVIKSGIPGLNWNIPQSDSPPHDFLTDSPLCQGCKTNEPGQMAHMGYMGCLNSDTLDDGL